MKLQKTLFALVCIIWMASVTAVSDVNYEGIESSSTNILSKRKHLRRIKPRADNSSNSDDSISDDSTRDESSGGSKCNSPANNCDLNAICTATRGVIQCECIAGYTGDGTLCSDINECESDTNDCSVNANCTNTPGSFECDCLAGFTGDGTNCTDINECESDTNDCSVNANCTNTPGSFECDCLAGFTGDGTNCTDINECESDTNDCSMNANCTNTPGSFECACNVFFTGDGTTCTAGRDFIVGIRLGTPADCSTFSTLSGRPVSAAQPLWMANEPNECADDANQNVCAVFLGGSAALADVSCSVPVSRRLLCAFEPLY